MTNKLTDQEYDAILQLVLTDGITYDEIVEGAVEWIVLTWGGEKEQNTWSSLSDEEKRIVTFDLKDNLHSAMAAAGEARQSQWDYE